MQDFIPPNGCFVLLMIHCYARFLANFVYVLRIMAGGTIAPSKPSSEGTWRFEFVGSCCSKDSALEDDDGAKSCGWSLGVGGGLMLVVGGE